MAKLHFIDGVKEKALGADGLADALCKIYHTHDKPLLSAFKCDQWASEAERLSADWSASRHSAHSTHDIPYERI